MTEHDLVWAIALSVIVLLALLILVTWFRLAPRPRHLSTSGPGQLVGLPPAAERQAKWDTLTAREQEVCRLAARGLSNPAIARELVISSRTAETHLGNSYQKLGVNSRDLLAFYLQSLVDKHPNPPP